MYPLGLSLVAVQRALVQKMTLQSRSPQVTAQTSLGQKMSSEEMRKQSQ